MIYNNLNRVKGILSAQQGTQVPKYSGGAKFKLPYKGMTLYSIDKESWFTDEACNDPFTMTESDEFRSALSNVQYVPQNIDLSMKIPGGSEATPYTAAEDAAKHNEISKQIVDKMIAERQAQATELPKVTVTAKSSNSASTLNVQPLANKITPEEISAGMQKVNQNLETLDQKEALEKAQKWGQVGQAAAQGIQAIGGAFGASQQATDSNLTKGVDSGVDAVGGMLSQMGGIAGGIGQILQIGSAAGQIIEGITGGTDQMTATDKFFDSGIGTVLGGWVNQLWGKNSDAFGIDQSMAETVGTSYGGSMDQLNETARTSDKKYGLFSAKARRKANENIAAMKATQNQMSNIADTATDQRLAVQSMGEQAGLAYSIMTDGGYNQKYTYAAKHGGSLEWNPVIELEWEPQVELNWELPALKKGGNIDINEELEWVPAFKDSNKLDFDTWFNSIPVEYRANGYDYKKAYEVFDWNLLSKHAQDPKNNHLGSVSPVADENGNFPFLKLGKLEENKELQGEFDWYNSDEGKEHKNKYDIKFIDGRYYYIPKQLKQGGSVGDSDIPETEETTQKNVIPEGALHKNKHHMEHAEGLTKKGIPVVDEDGEQQAEIEHSEIIFTLEVTKKLEEYYEIFYSEESTNKEKEQAALDAGKLLVYQILENTEDRTGLIESCKKGGTLTFNKDTEDLIEEVLEWIPTVVVIEETDQEKLDKKDCKKSEEKSEIAPKEEIKQMLKEVLIELLLK